MEENNLLKKMIDSKSGEFDRTTKIQEIVREKNYYYLCNKCDFIGKSEPGLKVHKGAKHKDTILKGYRKMSKA